ncbi:hypothetical protein CESP606_18430 [Cereibacter sphaeroides]|jgi:hypothetical protein|nr:hypothetical protein [Cereibacter sphaeroides]AMJ49747.1 hypothetical protein APX01_19480 [Cereibacter sphaeroides]ANS36509.1 hypothetical protein A3858_19765 [Cereibacter sphaeroides]ATN65521.1 hypothetical protein A3857_19510 [Cereibacter sphaeroides]QJC86857.1 hypothetical protein HGN32_22020 [Cereibacter sphaeroides]GEM95412.1 hypothetical protein RSP03_44790 [Cereibacter sphaeroides]
MDVRTEDYEDLCRAWAALGDAPQELAEIVGERRGAEEGVRLDDLFAAVARLCDTAEEPSPELTPS